jgi:hypothetical protein
MLPEGFEPALPTDECSQSQILDRAATGIEHLVITSQHFRKEAEEFHKTMCVQMSRGGDLNRRPRE